MTAPLYEKVKASILKSISDRSLGPGDRVPSENELVKTHAVSRMTANRALKELTAEGFLTRAHGKGTFVAERRVRSHPLRIQSIRRVIEDRGRAYTATLLALVKIPAGDALADEMQITPGDPVFHVRLVHAEDGVPMQLEDRVVNAAVVPDFGDVDFESQPPTEYLLERVPLHHAEHTVRAAPVTGGDAVLLDIEDGAACLIIHRRTFTGGDVASIATLIHPGSRFELTGDIAEPQKN